MILDKTFDLCKPQLPHLENGYDQNEAKGCSENKYELALRRDL